MTSRALERVTSFEKSLDTWDWAEVSAHCLREARRILASPAAEDAAQEAVLRVWRVGTRAGVRNPKAWLTRVARNEAIRVGVREAALARRRADDDTLEILAGPDEEFAEVMDRLAASALIAGLPDGDRRLLTMRYIEDLTQQQVANRLGIAEGAAKVRLHRARKRLERELRGGR